MVIPALCTGFAPDGKTVAASVCPRDAYSTDAKLRRGTSVIRCTAYCVESNRDGFVYHRKSMSCSVIKAYLCLDGTPEKDDTEIVYLRGYVRKDVQTIRELAHGKDMLVVFKRIILFAC